MQQIYLTGVCPCWSVGRGMKVVFFITDFDVHLIISRSGLLIGQSKDLHCVTLGSEREYESGCMSKFSKFTSGTIAGIGTAKQLITAA